MMKRLASILLLACCAPLPAPRPIIVAEGVPRQAWIEEVRVDPAGADAYYGCLESSVIPRLRADSANRGIQVLRHDGGDAVTFTLVSTWDAERPPVAPRCAGAALQRATEMRVAYEAVR